MVSYCILMTMNLHLKNMIYSNVLQKFLNRPIHVFSIFKKQKHRQEKHRLKQHWKEYEAEQWPCSIVMNCRIQLRYYFNRYRHWVYHHLACGFNIWDE